MSEVCDNTCMQAIDALLQRRSGRSLTEPGPDAGALELMFASAVRAPDHGALRPWRFLVIRGAARERFGELLAQYLRRAHPGTPPEALQRERHKAFRAPLIVVVAAKIDPAQRKIPQVEQLLSAGAAAHGLLLAADALGFAGVWKTGAATYDNEVKRALGFEDSEAIVGFLYLGTEATPGAPQPGPPRDWRGLVRVWEN
ncbi:MAG: nitroreductase [Proteobacteria bacterium]|nr:nitroreductase [Pseudomonadota bacterium]